MDHERVIKHLQDIIDRQNNFILTIFNDNAIPSEIKDKYAETYNDLAVDIRHLDFAPQK